MASSISEQSSKSKTAHGTPNDPGPTIYNLLEIAGLSSKANKAITLHNLLSTLASRDNLASMRGAGQANP